MEKVRWQNVASPAALVVIASLLAGCAGWLRADVQGAVCKPSESSLCSQEPQLTLK